MRRTIIGSRATVLDYHLGIHPWVTVLGVIIYCSQLPDSVFKARRGSLTSHVSGLICTLHSLGDFAPRWVQCVYKNLGSYALFAQHRSPVHKKTPTEPEERPNLGRNAMCTTKSQRHPKDFPGGPPPQYYPGLALLNFRVRMGSGALSAVWPLAIA